MNIKLNGELFDFIILHGKKRGNVYIVEYDTGYTFTAKPKTGGTFLTIKQSKQRIFPPYIKDINLYAYVIANSTIHKRHSIWDLFLNAYYKGGQVCLTACDSLVYITSYY